MYKISILLICPNHYLRLLAVKQAVDAVMDNDTAKGLHKTIHRSNQFYFGEKYDR